MNAAPSLDPYLGERTWHIKEDPDGGAILVGLNGGVWRGPAMEAKHYKSQLIPATNPEVELHPAPQPNCTCGIYSRNPKYPLERVGIESVYAVGWIRSWGRAFEGTKGYRAQFAQMCETAQIVVECFASQCFEPPAKVYRTNFVRHYVYHANDRQWYQGVCGEHVERLMPFFAGDMLDLDEWMDRTILQLESRYKVPFWTWHDFTNEMMKTWT